MNGRSGYSVGNALQQAVQGVNAHAQECFAAFTKLDGESKELVERRGKALLELAEHYLPTIDSETVAGTFQEVRGQLMDVLSRKQRRERELEATLSADQEEHSRLGREVDRVTVALNQKVAQREVLEKEVAKQLETDVEFQRLSKEALVAETELNRNEQRVTEIQNEAKEKLPSYEKSGLFQYLHKRGYGTPGYNRSGLTKTLDKWVAGMIDFNRARRGYEFLRVTPELMAQEVSRRRDRFNALMELVEACEDRHSDAVGLTRVMREGQELGVERDKYVADLGKQQDAVDKHRQDMVVLEGKRNEFYEQALARMKEFLATLETWRLEHTSRVTPEPQDDQIVAELKWLDEELAQRKLQGEELASEQGTWKKRGTELQDIWIRFRRADFDAGRSSFHDDFDIEGYLERFLRGQMSPDDLWNSIRTAQQFAPPWHDDSDYDQRGRGGGVDFSQVLLRVLTEIAGQALRHAAERGMERRAPYRQQQRADSGRPQFGNQGFTRGRGF